jgi:molybdate transport system ATP-binding protein
MTLRIAFEHRLRFLHMNLAFEVPAHGFTVLFGPPNAGTAFMLSAMAGLKPAKLMQLELDEQKLHEAPVHRRDVAIVFPEGRLFAHLSVAANLAFGMDRIRRPRVAPTRKQIPPLQPGEVTELLGLRHLLKRRPAALSASERQRVALGRALLRQPRVLLMDDPLATLDDAQRGEMLAYLQRLREASPLPVLYATGTLDEAQRLAHHIVLLEGGQVLGAGPLPQMASRVDLPLAARDDAAAILHGQIHSHTPTRGLSAVACGSQIIDIPLCDLAEETPVRLRIPAREVMLALATPEYVSANNILRGMVCAMRQNPGSHVTLVEVEISGGQVLARMSSEAARRLRLEPGTHVQALIKSVSAELLPA